MCWKFWLPQGLVWMTQGPKGSGRLRAGENKGSMWLVTEPKSFGVKVKGDQLYPALWTPQTVYSPRNSLGWNTGNSRVRSLSLLQGIFPTQGSNSGLLHCRQIPYQLSHKGIPRTLTGMGSLSLLQRISRSRNRTGVSCTAGGFHQLSYQGSPPKNIILPKINQPYN